MSAPETEAGRRLLDALALPWKPGSVGYEGMVAEGYLPAILRIEREAARIGADAVLAEAIRRVEGLPYLQGVIREVYDVPAEPTVFTPIWGDTLDREDVLKLLRDLADA